MFVVLMRKKRPNGGIEVASYILCWRNRFSLDAIHHPITDFCLPCLSLSLSKLLMMMMMSDVDLLFLTFSLFPIFIVMAFWRPVNLLRPSSSSSSFSYFHSVQRHSGCPPVVLDFTSPLRSNQIAGTARTSALLVPAPARARLPHRVANLPARRHWPPQPIQVKMIQIISLFLSISG